MSVEAKTPAPSSDRRLFSRGIVWGRIALALFIAAQLGHAAGQRHSDVHTDIVTGYVGVDETSFQLGSDVQGFVLSSVRWTDANGQTHEPGTVPDCLTQPGRNATMRVSWVPVVTPDGDSWNQVFWLDCRETTYVEG